MTSPAPGAAAPTANPFARIDRLNAIAPLVEELADGYWAAARPLVEALSEGLAASVGQSGWDDHIFVLGPTLRAAGLAGLPQQLRDCDRWGCKPPEPGRAGWAVCDLLAAAVADDRSRFLAMARRLEMDSEATAYVPEALLDVSTCLTAERYLLLVPACYHRLQAEADRIGEPFAALLGHPPGRPLPLSGPAREALRHWDDWRTSGGRYVPHGAYGWPTPPTDWMIPPGTVARATEVDPPPGPRPRRDPRKPGEDRQSDIIAAIRADGTPLQRGEIQEALRMQTEGKLGANLAWMVEAGLLVNIPGRGYWPAADARPV